MVSIPERRATRSLRRSRNRPILLRDDGALVIDEHRVLSDGLGRKGKKNYLRDGAVLGVFLKGGAMGKLRWIKLDSSCYILSKDGSDKGVLWLEGAEIFCWDYTNRKKHGPLSGNLAQAKATIKAMVGFDAE